MFPKTGFSQKETNFKARWLSHNVASFYDSENYVVVGFREPFFNIDSLEVRGELDTGSAIGEFALGINPSSYDVEVDWRRNRVVFTLLSYVEESIPTLGYYEQVDGEWEVFDYSSFIPEGHVMGTPNITDIDEEGRFAITVFKEGRIFEDQECAILIIQSTEDGLVLLETIDNACDKEYTDLALTYSEDLEYIIASFRVAFGIEGVPKGRIITYHKNDSMEYTAIDTLYSPYDNVPFGSFLEYHQNMLYVSSSEISVFQSSDEHWTYNLDVYEWRNDQWELEDNLYFFESLSTFDSTRRRYKMIDIENDIIAYTTFGEDLVRFHVSKLDEIEFLSDQKSIIFEINQALNQRIPSVELSNDGSEILISGYFDENYKCGIFDTNITTTKEEDLQITNPLKNTIFLDKLTLKDGFLPQKLSLYNLSGQLLVSSQLDSELDGLGILPSGMYVLVVGQKEERRLFKVVKL